MFSEPEYTRERYEAEFEFVKREFRTKDDKIVLCHSDGFWTNMIYDKDAGDNT